MKIYSSKPITRDKEHVNIGKKAISRTITTEPVIVPRRKPGYTEIVNTEECDLVNF